MRVGWREAEGEETDEMARNRGGPVVSTEEVVEREGEMAV